MAYHKPLEQMKTLTLLEKNLENFVKHSHKLCNINEALGRSLNVLRKTVHSSIKETAFERHYGRKPRKEIHDYLNVSPNKNYKVSARPETLHVYSFTKGNGVYNQLVMKAPRNLKEDVSNKFTYLFLEKQDNRDKFESVYENKPLTAGAGTKHTIVTDTNKLLQKKTNKQTFEPTISEPLFITGKTRGEEMEDSYSRNNLKTTA